MQTRTPLFFSAGGARARTHTHTHTHTTVFMAAMTAHRPAGAPDTPLGARASGDGGGDGGADAYFAELLGYRCV